MSKDVKKCENCGQYISIKNVLCLLLCSLSVITVHRKRNGGIEKNNQPSRIKKKNNRMKQVKTIFINTYILVFQKHPINSKNLSTMAKPKQLPNGSMSRFLKINRGQHSNGSNKKLLSIPHKS